MAAGRAIPPHPTTRAPGGRTRICSPHELGPGAAGAAPPRGAGPPYGRRGARSSASTPAGASRYGSESSACSTRARFHETGALAGWGTYEDGELADFLPANVVVGQGRIDGRRAVVQGDDFTVRGRRGGCGDLAEDGLRRADGERAAPAAGAARRRDGRGRQRQVARDDGLHLRPVHPGLGGGRREPVGGARGGRRPRAGGRSRRGARRRLALLRDRARHRAAVRRRAARGGGRDG